MHKLKFSLQAFMLIAGIVLAMSEGDYRANLAGLCFMALAVALGFD